MIAYTFLVLLTLVVAFLEARQDASDIKKHVRIDHAAQLWERSRLLGVVVFCTIVGSCWENGAVKWEWRALFFLPTCWAVFTIAFRLMLNWLRALPFDYISTSNAYDRFWMLRFRTQKKAARAQYITELTVLALCTAGYFYFTNT